MLSNVPPEFLPYFKKPKLLELFKGFADGLRKKLETDSDMLRIVENTLNTYTIFDFALIVVYRLYAYYEGFLNL